MQTPSRGESIITVSTTIPLSKATTKPLTTETLTQQLSRLGDTPFELASLTNNLEGDCHLPLSVINQLRREVAADCIRQAKPTPATPSTTTYKALLPNTRGDLRSPSIPTESQPSSAIALQSQIPASLSVLARTEDQLAAAIEAEVETIYCDFEDPRRYKAAVQLFKSTVTNPRSSIFLSTPRIIKTGETGYLKLIERAEPDGLLLRNLASLHHYRDRSDLRKIGDFSLNVSNPLTAKILKESANLERLTVSYDLNISQVLHLINQTPPEWLELTLHQHMPMFHMEHCVFCTFLSSGTTYKDCGRPCEKHIVHLRDRVGQLHRLQADVGCRNTLFNGRAQTGARFFSQLLLTGLRNYRIELLDEDNATALTSIRTFQNLLAKKITPEQLMTQIQAIEKLGVTEGTLA